MGLPLGSDKHENVDSTDTDPCRRAGGAGAGDPQRVGHAAELAGATLPDALSAGDKLLKLNGLGLRKKAMFKVYVGGLYLESPSKDAGTILATDQAKAIRMHFLRDLTKAQLVEAFQEGVEANAKDAAAQKAAFDKMLAVVPDVKEGDTLTFTYLPGRGTSLHAGDKELGIFAGKGFADAVFSSSRSGSGRGHPRRS